MLHYKNYSIVGVMSGTSLDGLDIAYCEFFYHKSWHFKIVKSTTIPYNKYFASNLKLAPSFSGEELIKLHNDFGKYIGKNINDFLNRNNLVPHYIASHGHTIFHRPENQLTFQIGNGAFIASESRIPTICDFRSLDIALGGQGAPLVPIGDKLLFNEYDYCLNLGGIANISFDKGNKRIAYDICPANMALNHICYKHFSQEYDRDGELAKKGKLNKKLFTSLNTISFYKEAPPKSLGREWFELNILPLIGSKNISGHDLLHTYVHHTAFQISRQLDNLTSSKLFVTGGGALNNFLVSVLKEYTNTQIIVPEKDIINFKEALIFAFLGLLKVNKTPNCLPSVTGASLENIGGVIYEI